MNQTGSIFESLNEFLARQGGGDIPIFGFAVGILLAAGSAHLLGRLYIRCGRSLSHRPSFAANFLPLAVTTMLVINIVKSSLALSLGMVGALSIVRFRAAIKEPEEVNYLFLALALGLGYGANQWLVTIVAFTMISGLLLLRERFHREAQQHNLYLTVSSREPNKVKLEDVVRVLRQHTTTAAVKRVDETADAVEATFVVDFSGFEQLQAAKAALQALDGSLTLSFVDTRGIG